MHFIPIYIFGLFTSHFEIKLILARFEFSTNYYLFKLELFSNIPQQKQTNTDVQYV